LPLYGNLIVSRGTISDSETANDVRGVPCNLHSLTQANDSRVYQSANRYASGVALPDKFQGRRTTLEVKIPDLEEPEISLAIDAANIVSRLNSATAYLTTLF
jgi:hypothetical protein